MRIEVATNASEPTKTKGDLLENLSAQVLKQQNYEVMQQVRKTATELDLLCKHNVSTRTLYVECKAHRDTLSSKVLTNLLGTLHFHNYDEAWLITTGPLGKDAKGFVEEWSNKPKEERKSLSVYTTDRIVDLLCNANLISSRPIHDAARLVKNVDLLGEWTLIITHIGVYWGVVVTKSGVPTSTLFFDAKSGNPILDLAVLRQIGNTDTTIANLDYELIKKLPDSSKSDEVCQRSTSVVQVQAGEDWADYRPARPEYFIGRKDAQDRILTLLESIRTRESLTRVFSITGDSGMGKSSLIAKLRDRCTNVRNRNKLHLYAVDVRAATDPSYVHSALLEAFSEAFPASSGSQSNVKISDYADPLSSPSIASLLSTFEANNQVVCLVFDQFEELYSKPELFSVFEEAQRLFISAITASSSLVLGFAWKTDATVQQGHPAYFMWHSLSDHRYEVGLTPFSHSEASSTMTMFQKVIGTKLRPELRRQIIENCQGYPWLLKKLCLHVWEQIRQGVSQEDLAETLDVASLFNRDIQILTSPELTCLRAVANNAPADWYDIINTYGEDVIRSLHHRRLVVRSGDRLNVYWDIFKDYLLTNSVPALPFTYLPTSALNTTLLNVAGQLDHKSSKTLSQISDAVSIKESTLQNVIHDLRMFGVAQGSAHEIYLSERLQSSDGNRVLLRIRDVLSRHALTLNLAGKFDRGETIRQEDMIDTLRNLNRAAQHNARTWIAYADRMGTWLVSTGLATSVIGGLQLQERGEIQIPATRRHRSSTFKADAPPHSTIRALSWLLEKGSVIRTEVLDAGFRNAFAVLCRFGLADLVPEGRKYVPSADSVNCGCIEAVWRAAKKDNTLNLVVHFLNKYPLASGKMIGTHINEISKGELSEASLRRQGNGLRRWAVWMLQPEINGTIPDPPKDKTRNPVKQKTKTVNLTLF